MASTSARMYRGVQAADRRAERRARLLDAGLSILGADSRPDPLTVRGVCQQAGLSARYFYESFADRDDFVGAVYDWLITDLTATTTAAVAAAPRDGQARAAMANIVRVVAGDERVARLFFSRDLADPVVIRKRHDSYTLLATLFSQYMAHAMGVPDSDQLRATAHFAVGGGGQALTAWLAGEVVMTQEQLIDQLASHLHRVADPALHRA